MEIKAVIFDWARTLYDVDNNREFPEAVEILEYCKQKRYHLALVSLVSKDESIIGTTLEARNQQINDSKLNKFDATFSNLANGLHSYTVYALDGSGNLVSSGQRTFNVNATITCNL